MKYGGTSSKRSYNSYIDLLKRIQNNEWEGYDFSDSVYITAKTKLEVFCIKHGRFWIRPNNLKGGTKCPSCHKNTKKLPEVYYQEIKENFNMYEVLEDYINNNTKILHKHKACGYEWKVTPRNILSNRGCPKCAKKGFSPKLPAILYYLSVKNGTAFKIGITNRTVHERYSNEELQDIEVIEEWKYNEGIDAYIKEQEIIKKYKAFKYIGLPLLKSGNTEMFNKDIRMQGENICYL